MTNASQIHIRSTAVTPATRSARFAFADLRRETSRIVESIRAGFDWPYMKRHFDFVMSYGTDAMGIIPAIDMRETEKEFILTAELPGMNVEEILVRYSDDALIISGDKIQSPEDKTGCRQYRERSFGPFVRTFQMPCIVDVKGIEAILTNGVLRVRLPKAQTLTISDKTIALTAI